ncbi:MAG TPA: nuclear transport factor 2 family protein [Rhizomicrobium sp.]|jgi:ketosteroid isomerase-like protein|nr:nuclear transport factor 2 family protein [Rhizomicrobium sp.]
MSDLSELARRYYRAYETGDRAFMENHLAPDFTFTSPYDDAIGREAYFARCWPNHQWLGKFDLEMVAAEGNRVMILYRIQPKPAHQGEERHAFRNAECMTFENGKLKQVEVFFGDPPRGMSRAQFAAASGAG